MQPNAQTIQAVNLTVLLFVAGWWTLMMGRNLSIIAPALTFAFMMSLLIHNIQKDFKQLSVGLGFIVLAVFVSSVFTNM